MTRAGERTPAPLRAARAVRHGISRAVAFMAYLAGWNYILCALFITGDVLGRTFLQVSSAATVEITSYMLACGISWSLAHTLASRAHIRVDVLVNRMPLRLRTILHVFALVLLGGFAVFVAWAAWSLLDESLMFDAHDNSALHLPMAIPQGIWAFGMASFVVMIVALLVEAILGLLLGRFQEVDQMLDSRSIDDEAEEALEAVAMAREGHPA